MKKNPCKECPFRKDSLPGWLGTLSGAPEVFMDGIDHTIIPCHMKIDKADGLIERGETNPCVGALQFCANSLKFPRAARGKNSTYGKLLDKVVVNDEVFQWSHEFIQHHTVPKTKK